MAFDAFLAFKTQSDRPTLEGETQDVQFSKLKAIEINSFSLGIHNTINIGSSASDSGGGKAQFSEFKISKAVDRLSPNLLEYAGLGQHIVQADLYLRGAGGASGAGLVFLHYIFRLVYVSNVEWSASSGDEAVQESVTFEYGAMQIEFTAEATNGKKETTYNGQWNRVTNHPDINIPGLPG